MRVTFLNARTLNEDKGDDTKVKIYEDLVRIFDQFLKHHE
jgi:hypothetical protein